MADVRFVLNTEGVRQLLTSPAVQADLDRRAAAIASAAGGNGGLFEHQSVGGARRARAMVWTGDEDARRAEATDRTLTQAIDAGRS